MRPEFFFTDYFRDDEGSEIQSFKDDNLKLLTQKPWPKFKKSNFWQYTNPELFFKNLNKRGENKDNTITNIDDYLLEDAINILDTDDGFLVRDVLPKGIKIIHVNEYIKENKIIEKGNKDIENFLKLNGAFLNSGFILEVEENTIINIPVQIIFTKGYKHVFRRNFIKVGRFSKVEIIETYISENRNNLFFNINSDIRVEESAVLSHYKLEFSNKFDFIFNNLNVDLEKDAVLNGFYYTNGGGKIKNNLIFNLIQEGADVSINGLYVLKERNHIDNTTSINHIKGNTKSTQIYKGLLDDESEAVFDGLVEIFKDAKLSNSNQLNQNLLLSETAVINSKPQLIIGNDDVKCSHGSTSGQIDKNQLFYLGSRGIGEKEAKKLLSKAFVNEILLKLKNEEIKEFLLNYINNRLD